MSYLIGQMRKQSGVNYMTGITGITPLELKTPNVFYTGSSVADKGFKDFALYNSSNFEGNNVYYLRFKTLKVPQYFYHGINQNLFSLYSNADQLSFTIYLANSNGVDLITTTGQPITTQLDTNYFQQIGTFSISVRTELQSYENLTEEEYNSLYESFSFVFTPIRNYNTILFKMNRTTYDVLEQDTENGERRWLACGYGSANSVTNNSYTRYDGNKDITVYIPPSFIEYDNSPPKNCNIDYTRINNNEIGNGQISKLNNIIDKKLNKIGYQCRPGALIAINNQPIRVGRSGIYELNNGMIIDSFMIASPGGTNSQFIDAFLLDYAYSKSES